MNLRLSDIPDVAGERSASAEPSTMRAALIESSRMSRRSLGRLVIGTAVASSMASMQVLKAGPAAAADLYSTWQNCSDYDAVDTSSDNDWRWCNPNGSAQGHIGSGYCQSGWHRSDTVSENICMKTQYDVAYRCTGDNGVKKNAWEWHKNDVLPEPDNVRCSDGRVRYMDACTWGAWYNSTCKKALAS